ncbi:MAG TPA: hypothetical protein VGV88_13315 [Candidatus Dormibacteraeota bacterium]|nr:hypothetical protein [Candidatus Dormibacteraeota bacterium]
MPDLSHLWQRFLLAAAMLAGLAIGIGATVFGYSNLDTIDIHWSVLQLRGVPVWTVVLVPITLILILGTVFHWLDGLHHFTEHMRHRRRVHELEAEVARLRAHLDQALGMPQHAGAEEAAKAEASAAPAEPATETSTTDSEMAGVGAAEEAKPAKAGSKKKGKVDEAPPATENGDGKVAEPAIAASTSSAATDQD